MSSFKREEEEQEQDQEETEKEVVVVEEGVEDEEEEVINAIDKELEEEEKINEEEIKDDIQPCNLPQWTHTDARIYYPASLSGSSHVNRPDANYMHADIGRLYTIPNGTIYYPASLSGFTAATDDIEPEDINWFRGIYES